MKKWTDATFISGRYARTYAFTTLNANNGCDSDSSCEGYSFQGNYAMTTEPDGESYLEVNTHLKSEKSFDKKDSLSIGWGIDIGTEVE